MTKLRNKAVFGVWCKAPSCLTALSAADHRHDLDGNSVAPVSAEAMTRAKTKLEGNDGQRKRAQWSGDRRDETVQRMWLRQESDRVRRHANKHLQGLRLVRSAQSLGGGAKSECAKGVTGRLVSRPTVFLKQYSDANFQYSPTSPPPQNGDGKSRTHVGAKVRRRPAAVLHRVLIFGARFFYTDLTKRELYTAVPDLNRDISVADDVVVIRTHLSRASCHSCRRMAHSATSSNCPHFRTRWRSSPSCLKPFFSRTCPETGFRNMWYA